MTEAEKRAMNALIGEKIMGNMPRISWEATNDDGKSSAFSSYTHDDRFDRGRVYVEKWLKDMQQRGLCQGYTIVSWKHWPDYCDDIRAAFEVAEKMRADGFRVDLSDVNPKGEPKWYAKFMLFTPGEFPTYWMERDDAPTLAICRAALAACKAIRAAGGGGE